MTRWWAYFAFIPFIFVVSIDLMASDQYKMNPFTGKLDNVGPFRNYTAHRAVLGQQATFTSISAASVYSPSIEADTIVLKGPVFYYRLSVELDSDTGLPTLAFSKEPFVWIDQDGNIWMDENGNIWRAR
jgi:hypothetical protein